MKSLVLTCCTLLLFARLGWPIGFEQRNVYNLECLRSAGVNDAENFHETIGMRIFLSFIALPC